MPLPSKLLLRTARPRLANRFFSASSFETVPSFSTSKSSHCAIARPSCIGASSLRLYSTPSAFIPIDPSLLLDKAPDLGEAFALPPPPPPPAPPIPASPVDPAASPVDHAASIVDLGLGGYTPPGLVQHALDGLHSLGLPWWGCIVGGAVVVRACMVPLFAAVQRNSITMLNHAPELQQFQMRMLAAREVGDKVGVLRVAKEMKKYMRENDISHFRQVKLFACQCVVFCSMFLGIRHMAELPVESFKTEGLLHIMDLTVRDPFFIMPSLTMSTLALTLWLGSEGIPMHDFPPIMKKIFMLIPIVAFVPVAYFPSAMSLYWVTSNFVSLAQFLLFRSEFGKKLFRIPERRATPQGFGMGLDQKGFAEQFTKMVATAQEAANTQAKLQSMELPDDRRQWEGVKREDDTVLGAKASNQLKPEEVAARHQDIKRMIKEINDMKKKVEALHPDAKKDQKTNKPPDIHIKIPKDKIE